MHHSHLLTFSSSSSSCSGMDGFYKNLFSVDNVATGGGPRDFATRAQPKKEIDSAAAAAATKTPAPQAQPTAAPPARAKEEPLKRERSLTPDASDSAAASKRRRDERSVTPPAVSTPSASTSAPKTAAPSVAAASVVSAVPTPTPTPAAKPAPVAAAKLDDAAIQAARERFLARKKQQQ